MSEGFPNEMQRWTAKRRAALIVSILRGETSAPEAARRPFPAFAGGENGSSSSSLSRKGQDTRGRGLSMATYRLDEGASSLSGRAKHREEGESWSFKRPEEREARGSRRNLCRECREEAGSCRQIHAQGRDTPVSCGFFYKKHREELVLHRFGLSPPTRRDGMASAR
jgi:hypothetical protein